MLNDLVAKIDDYLDGNSSLRQFKEWFFDLSVDVERRFAGPLVELVHRIEGILAEASSGNWSPIILDRELNIAVEPFRSHSPVIVRSIVADRSKESKSSISSALRRRHFAI